MSTVRSSLRANLSLIERIERLEAALFHGNPVETIHVPSGMSVAEAWQLHKTGETLPGTRRFVLTDNNGNLLKVLN